VTFEDHFSTVVTLCAQLTRDLSAMAKFFVAYLSLPCIVAFSISTNVQKRDEAGKHNYLCCNQPFSCTDKVSNSVV